MMRCGMCEWEDESMGPAAILGHLDEAHGFTDVRLRFVRDDVDEEAAPFKLRSA
jgi:hypothetical protein